MNHLLKKNSFDLIVKKMYNNTLMIDATELCNV